MDTTFQSLKTFDFDSSTTHLWVFKTSTSPAKFKALYVQTDDTLNNQLKRFVISEIQRISEQSPYSYISQTNESSCLSIEQEETDFNLLKAQIDKIESEHRASGLKDIKNAKGYVVKLTHNGSTVYAVKRSTSTWKTAYSKKYINMIFDNGELTSVENNGFSIEKNFDFYAINNALFIANKRGFESALQYKTAYSDAFSQLRQNTSFTNLFNDLDPLVEYVGNNSIQLRRMAVIEEKGIYNHPNFLPNLQIVNTQHSWGINFDPTTNKISPCDETVKVIMQILLDHRLMSQITENIYDVPDTVKV